MGMNVEAEIRDLKRRVGELEGSFGFLTRQVKSVHKDLTAFQARTEQRFDKIDGRLDKHDGRFDKVDGRFDKVEGRLDRVEIEIRGLRNDMPAIVGDAMRAALRESRRKPGKTP
jgi:archaellum component FlaC